MSRIFIVAPPAFKGRNELFITRHIAAHITGGEIIWIGGQEEYRADVVVCVYHAETWMLHQQRCIRELLHAQPQTGDQIVFADFWFPGLDMIKLVLEERGQAPKMVGYLHGASFVEGDPFATKWAPHLEKAWMEMYDVIWSASQFFVKHIPPDYAAKVQIVGEPFSPAPYTPLRRLGKKEFDIVYPHRLGPDKGFDQFVEILRILGKRKKPPSVLVTAAYQPGPEYVQALSVFKFVTLSVGCTDEEHAHQLSCCKVVLSTAIQEGWGYAVLKAISLGCVPCLPNRAVYPELYERRYLYDTTEQAVELVTMLLDIYPAWAFVPPETIVGGELKNGYLVGRIG